ncbi:ABC transporter ATP-binding protein [Corynebacterium sp. UMB0012]|uniref:ABC transporter ATP-binding protein n=1 Tax=unclassified Corynebacterium TaxID=2624378 RepID=UPI001EF4CF3E|nr:MULTISPECIES: ABC transporter ATP-binding protein [unclassified Corynebacterium]MCG7445141.1 ABC transporter ATP-binding protein [Corynebacterium sp. ACRPO]MDK7047472.1 ABC transporter ATP-binding protein [Corynebacterium sp. UMB0012]
MLKADNLSKRYGRHTVLNRVNVSIAPGEFVAIMGPSGSGKTTLLNLLSGLDKPTSGRVNAPGRKQRAFVFQDYNLLESLNAQRNATLTARFSGRRPTRGKVAAVFDSLGLSGLERRLPAQLSGGQQQRVAVARALLAQAPYIFADEPTGALDDATASTVLSHLRAAARDGASVVMVTHSHFAAEAADRIISLEEVAHAGVA